MNPRAATGRNIARLSASTPTPRPPAFVVDPLPSSPPNAAPPHRDGGGAPPPPTFPPPAPNEGARLVPPPSERVCAVPRRSDRLTEATGPVQERMSQQRPPPLPSGQRELTTRFKVQKFLGKGSYGSVYRVRKLSNGERGERRGGEGGGGEGGRCATLWGRSCGPFARWRGDVRFLLGGDALRRGRGATRASASSEPRRRSTERRPGRGRVRRRGRLPKGQKEQE